MDVETKKLARTESEPVKEIADFAKTHPYEYMRKCLEQYPYWGNKDNGFNRQKIQGDFFMSIKSAFEFEGIDFSQIMNPPESWDGQALIKNIKGSVWACCPFCQKKALLISPETKIRHLKLKCKGSNCKKEFEVNV